MTSPLLWIIIGIIAGLAIGIVLSYTLLKNSITKSSKEILKKAEEDAELLKKEKILQAKEKFLQLKSEHEKTVNEKNQQISAAENRIKQKENTLNQKLEEANKKINENNAAKENLKKQLEITTQKQAELDKQTSIQKQKLESIAELTSDQAKQQLISLMEEEAKKAAAQPKDACEETPKADEQKGEPEKKKGLLSRMKAKLFGESVDTSELRSCFESVFGNSEHLSDEAIRAICYNAVDRKCR